MIELFDPARLAPRRDRTALAALALAGVGVLVIGSQALWLQDRMSRTRADIDALRAAAGAPAAAVAAGPRTPLLEELQRQVDALEREVAAVVPAAAAGGAASPPAAAALQPSQWMDRLGQLAQPGVSLQKIQIERSGAVAIEGLAVHAGAIDAFVQSWQRHGDLARVETRSIEARADTSAAGGGSSGSGAAAAAAAPLRFHLRAMPPAAAPGGRG